MAQPDLILTPFGMNSPPGNIDVIPETLAPSDPPQKASWQGGFPPVTMIPLAAGGIPPRGQDFNGVLNAISQHTVFQGGGGQYKWSAEYVAAKGGYEKGAVIQSDDGLSSYVSAVDSNTINPNTTPGSIGNQWLDSGAGPREWIAETVPLAETEELTSTTRRAWTAQRFGQALRGAAAKSVIVDAVRPVGSHYIQFSETDGTFDSAKSPSTLFGGTWSLKFNAESVFFRTEGDLSAVGRVAGVQGDAIRNIYGEFYSIGGAGVSVSGAILANPVANSQIQAPVVSGVNTGFVLDASQVVPTATENRVTNRLIRVWERTA